MAKAQYLHWRAEPTRNIHDPIRAPNENDAEQSYGSCVGDSRGRKGSRTDCAVIGLTGTTPAPGGPAPLPVGVPPGILTVTGVRLPWPMC